MDDMVQTAPGSVAATVVPHTPHTSWADLAALPVVVEACEFEGRAARLTGGFERVTTVVRLSGAGQDGLGEDVSPFEGEAGTLHVLRPALPLAGEWTLGSLCARIAEVDLWPVAPGWDGMRRFRRWAFESAALDLALRQAGRPLHALIGREPRPVRFVTSFGLGDPPSAEPVRRRLERYPGVRFKLDADPGWTPALIAELAATAAVDIVDFKGHYERPVEDPGALLDLYRHVAAGLPEARLEDPHDLPGVAEVLAGEAHRISYDAPIHDAADLDRTPLPPAAVNVKPSRVGDLRSLLELHAACAARGLPTYGGGMGELDVGRGQAQLLAALFHHDAPNDVAPSAYNADPLPDGLPPSPLPPDPAATGFRRAG